MDEALEADILLLETALRTLIQTMKRPASWNRITAPAGISLDRPAATILHMLVAYEPKYYRLHELAAVLNIEAPSVTRKIQQLERAGYVSREGDPIDKRASVLRITAAGKAVTNRLREIQRQYYRDLLESWNSQDRKRFTELFNRFSQDLSQPSKNTPSSSTPTITLNNL